MSKLEYRTPVLRRYGSVAQLTLNGMGNAHDAANDNRRPSNAYSGWV